MSELKEYYVEQSAITGFINYTTNRLSLVVVYRADDPAIVSALKDSEDLQTIKDLVGAHSVDEIKQWRRSHEGMEKLEKFIQHHNTVIEHFAPTHRFGIYGKVRGIEHLFAKAGPSLISAIEKMEE